jgi:hypothetical protein
MGILVVVEDRRLSNDAAGEGLSPTESVRDQGFGDLRPYVPEDILNTRFPGLSARLRSRSG